MRPRLARALRLAPLLAFFLTFAAVGVRAQSLASRLNALLNDWKEKNAPGLAAMLIRNGRVEYRRTFGFADLAARTPITPDTQFLLASITKQFTAMAVMILAERHKLQIDDPLSKFCPEFPDYAREITLRNLLTHTSGLTEYDDLLGVNNYGTYFRSSKSPPAAHEWTSVEILQLLSRQQTLRFAPGEKFEYSNSGYVVLAQIIERVTGERYAEFLKENIFDPLDMRDTLVVDERKQKVPRLALGYAKRGGQGQWEDVTYSPENSVYGEDGIYSTIDDLYKWDQALYTERLVSRAMLEMAFTPGRTRDGKEISTDILPRTNSYGFGWSISSIRGEKTVEHSGGWSGYATHILRVPSRHLTAIVLMNSQNEDAIPIAQQMIELAMQ